MRPEPKPRPGPLPQAGVFFARVTQPTTLAIPLNLRFKRRV